MATIVKSDAVALRVEPFSRTSHVVTWLTPAHGKVTTLAKGVQKPRSSFLGQFDVFYTCELVYHASQGSALSTLRDCAPLHPRARLRTDWRAAAIASYACHLTEQVSPPEGDPGRVYALLTASLDLLDANGSHPLLAIWFESRLAHVIGLSPRLGRCTACRDALAPTKQDMRFAPVRGGALCAACAATAGEVTLPLPPDVWAILRTWQAAEAPTIVLRTTATPAQLNVLSALMGRFVAFHFDLPETARKAMIELVWP